MILNFFNPEYKINTASKLDIEVHLIQCDQLFEPPLHDYINIPEYSAKIFNHANTFECWNMDRLIGLIAAYINNIETRTGFITNVSVLLEFQKKGIAKELLKRSIAFAKEIDFRTLELEVEKNNMAALKMYYDFGFSQTENDNINSKLKMKLNL